MSFHIVGLGNPGEEYLNTRHNTGRIILELLAKKYNFSEFKDTPKIKALVSEGKIGKEKVTLVEPNNFMNRSGASLPTLITSVKKAHNVIVIYDDLDLPVGSIKISFNRSAGGHRGLESIIKALKTQEFLRIRVGISPTTPAGKLKKPSNIDDFIIAEFKKPELEAIKKVSKKITEAIEMIISESKEKAMSVFNNN